MPAEYTPEINQDYLANLLKGVDTEAAAQRGRARSEALARGLEGDVFEASAVGAVDSAALNEKSALKSDLAFKMAGLNRDERLMGQQRDWQVEDRNFAATQREADRRLQEKLAVMGFDAARDSAESGLFGDIAGGIIGAGGAALGGYLGRKR